jgi:tryptophan-rich sensory protein
MTRLDDLLPERGSDGVRRRILDLALASTPLLVGGLTSVGTMAGVRGWYRTLDRPSWKPPDEVFGPVWTTLYGLMGVSLVQIVRTPRRRGDAMRPLALGLFAAQLALNAAWSWIFFTGHAIGAALAEMLVLWLAIAATAATFAAIRPGAGALLLPYLAWVTFATVLTAEIWRRNR